MNVNIGDTVQIRNNGIDVTNGIRATSGRMYGEGGPLWAKVESIIYDWNTGGRFGLPNSVTKVRCENSGIIVWQVQPEDIADNIIRSSEPENVQTEPDPPEPEITVNEETNDANDLEVINLDPLTLPSTSIPYLTETNSEDWSTGITTYGVEGMSNDVLELLSNVNTTTGTPSYINSNVETYSSNNIGTWRSLNSRERASIGNIEGMEIDNSVLNGVKYRTAFQDPFVVRQMLNKDVENIQNSAGFPPVAVSHEYVNGVPPVLADRYNYQINISDVTDDNNISLEDKLRDARAAIGLPVHGRTDIAKAMKMYMYNRFKVPDTNLAHNKSFTHIFFTRPDCNLLNTNGTISIVDQARNHTESAMLWRRNPELFRLLTDGFRCGDPDNFNYLLSNQIRSFDIQDETLSTVEAGKSWNEYEMVYGDAYSGRAAGEFSCRFSETSDYSIINFIKLWITYIDNVARGAWSPSYNLYNRNTYVGKSITDSHVFTKTLDYGASCYAFKTGVDNEDILYVSKYYGVFPLNTGASALSWDNDSSPGDSPQLNIRFKYSFKRDMSPISLLEFNHNGNSNNAEYIESYDANYAGTVRPFVGTPFVEMSMIENDLRNKGMVNIGVPKGSVRLKFRKFDHKLINDNILYRSIGK